MKKKKSNLVGNRRLVSVYHVLLPGQVTERFKRSKGIFSRALNDTFCIGSNKEHISLIDLLRLGTDCYLTRSGGADYNARAEIPSNVALAPCRLRSVLTTLNSSMGGSYRMQEEPLE